jgi:cob(I)alamin adenosyltransferase
MKDGKVQIYYGKGKGKSTAGLGAAIRAAGAGYKVVIIYFDKGGRVYSERLVLDKMSGKIDYFVFGENRINPITGGFRFTINKKDIYQAELGLQKVYEIVEENKYDFLFLDELAIVTYLKMLEIGKVLDLIKNASKKMEIIITGRYCPKKLINIADLVTEMKEEKHYFKKGLKARLGIEF